MNRKKLIRLALFGAVCAAIFSSSIAQQSLTGTYTQNSGETTLTLTFDQSDTHLSGSLVSTTGASFTMEGQIIGGSGAGVCSGDDGFTYVSLNNGNRIVYNYKVHQENGKKYYKEYWINGSLYSKE